jgi:hypothetical protein
MTIDVYSKTNLPDMRLEDVCTIKYILMEIEWWGVH